MSYVREVVNAARAMLWQFLVCLVFSAGRCVAGGVHLTQHGMWTPQRPKDVPTSESLANVSCAATDNITWHAGRSAAGFFKNTVEDDTAIESIPNLNSRPAKSCLGGENPDDARGVRAGILDEHGILRRALFAIFPVTVLEVSTLPWSDMTWPFIDFLLLFSFPLLSLFGPEPSSSMCVFPAMCSLQIGIFEAR